MVTRTVAVYSVVEWLWFIHNSARFWVTDRRPFYRQGAFDAVRRLLSGAESSKMNLIEKSDMFFCDYSMMPLFMQENYLMVDPSQSRWVENSVLSESNTGYPAFSSLHFASWLVQKTHTIPSTNQILNLNLSRLGRPRFSALWAG